MDCESAKGYSQNDSPRATAEASFTFTFEEETRRADEYLQSAVQSVRAQSVPQGTEPAFLFRLLF